MSINNRIHLCALSLVTILMLTACANSKSTQERNSLEIYDLDLQIPDQQSINGRIVLDSTSNRFELDLFEDTPTYPSIGNYQITEDKIIFHISKNQNIESRLSNHPVVILEDVIDTNATHTRVFNSTGTVADGYRIKIEVDSLYPTQKRITIYDQIGIYHTSLLDDPNSNAFTVIIPFNFYSIVGTSDTLTGHFSDHNIIIKGYLFRKIN